MGEVCPQHIADIDMSGMWITRTVTLLSQVQPGDATVPGRIGGSVCGLRHDDGVVSVFIERHVAVVDTVCVACGDDAFIGTHGPVAQIVFTTGDIPAAGRCSRHPAGEHHELSKSIVYVGANVIVVGIGVEAGPLGPGTRGGAGHASAGT